ncbi:DsbA family protein [Nocardiopsis suaedae]|uniref:Thioredoxin domain-containing protein n=1 Tax=Nocardiopsis suaedae TaxID=3018444 RepID=A0ABT4TJX9_9ACTN|nr:thioredoxin domain-containing protein [Nocardiopsis suaedae]MDA2804696.1 thioredoxin domain-containing protein [Nocardiopsis suaedae]
MSRNLSITFGLLLVLALAFGIFAIVRSVNGGGPAEAERVSAETLVNDDSHYLDQPEGAEVTVVEFLDFECPACAQQYPVMEDIREKYEGDINFVVRYFPLPGHVNAEASAAAAEAAARQDSFEEMYQKLFETQDEWSGAAEPTPEVFVDYAEEIGLDRDQFVEDMQDPAILERVNADLPDGQEAGVQGTPTIFVNGRLMSSMPSEKQLSDIIDEELEAAQEEGGEQ